MTLRPLLTACTLLLAAIPPAGLAFAARAQESPAIQADLAETLRIPELVDILREEGFAYADTLDDDMFPGRGGPDWRARVEAVYDRTAMLDRFQSVLSREMDNDPAALAESIAFFGSQLGQRILTLEIEARRALLDESVEDTARARVEEMRAAEDPRIAALDRFVAVNDLIETNVQGALNANLGFYRGMVDAGGFGEAVDEGQMLSDVWSQEEEVREETRIWLYAYLALAYAPLSDDDLAAYIAFSETHAGKRLNAAVFAAFDAVFNQVSRELGRATALQMVGQDI